MNRSPRRRFGAALVLSLATLASSVPHALADAPATTAKPEAPAAAPATPSPPQAPAADPATKGLRLGARSKAGDGTLIIWDSVTGAWASPGRRNTYWVGERFYQADNGLWLTAKVLAGPWQLVAQNLVPEVIRARQGELRTSVTATLPSGRGVVYEPRLKAFKVAGRKGVFLFDATFYRYDNGVWLESSNYDGPWKPTSTKVLPATLRKAVPLPGDGQKVTLPTGETLVSQGSTGVFGVEGAKGTIFFEGSFYRREQDKWLVSDNSAAGFGELATSKVPAPVVKNYQKAGGGGSRSKGAGKDAAANKASPAAAAQ